jgi:Glycosyltransferase family 6
MVASDEEPLNSVGIVMIATNNYLSLWKLSVQSLEKNFNFTNIEVSIYLFTDQAEEAMSWIETHLSKVKVRVIKIPNLRWPEATLIRYRLVFEAQDLLTEPILMYLDSDMEVLKDFGAQLFQEIDEERMCLVIHPGYAPGAGRWDTWTSNPRTFLRDLKFLFKGQIKPGAWERRKVSQAYVPRNKRKTYVHGAIWFGGRKEFILMCKILSERVDLDKANSVIATWHDESHLNWFAANYEVNYLDSRFSWHRDYKNLKIESPFITTIDKNNKIFKKD